jgi:hypothetical protein
MLSGPIELGRAYGGGVLGGPETVPYGAPGDLQVGWEGR